MIIILFFNHLDVLSVLVKWKQRHRKIMQKKFVGDVESAKKGKLYDMAL